MILAVAAHRERRGHTGPDPLGPPPDDPEPRRQWHHLATQLHLPMPTPTHR
jgi:hypothetical protein